MADAQATNHTAEPEFTLGEARVQTARGFGYQMGIAEPNGPV